MGGLSEPSFGRLARLVTNEYVTYRRSPHAQSTRRDDVPLTLKGVDDRPRSLIHHQRPDPSDKEVSILNAILRSLLVLGCVVALMSVGGLGVYMSPLLIPLLFAASRTSRSMPAKAMWACLAALQAAEGTWGLTYALLGEAKPSIWLLPTVVGALLGLLVFKARGQHMVMKVQPGE